MRGREQLGDREVDRAEWTPFRLTGQTVPALGSGTPKVIVWANSRYVVVVRRIAPLVGQDAAGELVWLSVRSIKNDTRHDWRDLQRVKNELVGPEAEGVELYPAESRLVDCANQYHLWCFPNFRFPFGFAERRVADAGRFGGGRQRPFDPVDCPDGHHEYENDPPS